MKKAVCGPSMWTSNQNLGSDRPSNGQNRTLDQDYHFKVDEWTDFLPFTVHLMVFGQQIMVIRRRWTEVDGWTKTDRPPHGRIRTTDHDHLS